MKAAAAKVRPNQWRFRYDLMKRYGAVCAFCGLAVVDLLEAAHICRVEDGGSDDPRNGLVVCLNHHRDSNLGLIRIDPDALGVCTDASVDLAALGVENDSIRALTAQLHPGALRWPWDKHKDEEK